MAETDILNPPGWQVTVNGGMNPNPSYGFSRKPGANRQQQRPRLGPFFSRDVGNGGHVFPLVWVGTDLATAQRVTKFYHDFKHGYFTFINPDWGGRHFVGTFTSEPATIETGNGKWTIQDATFEEVPTARMLQYPNDWANDGHPINVVDDYFPQGSPAPRVALMQGAWVLQLDPRISGASATDPKAYEAFNAVPSGGDWAQMQYTGWGFQMTFRMANTLGKIHIALDGVEIVTALDLSAGTASATTAVASIAVSAFGSFSSVTVTAVSVPLDIHLVMVTYAGAGAAAGVSILFPALEYIY
jgi:hypothetical protein